MPSFKQPIEKAQLTGADRRHPERHRNEVPKSDAPLGDAPDHMREEAKQCWFELAALAIPGVLTGADRIMMEAAANHLADYRKNPSEYPTTRLNQFILILARFGMSPSDRTKLGVSKDKDDNPYQKLDD